MLGKHACIHTQTHNANADVNKLQVKALCLELVREDLSLAGNLSSVVNYMISVLEGNVGEVLPRNLRTRNFLLYK